MTEVDERGPKAVLLIGGGGREHALAAALAASPQVGAVLIAPGNAGTALEPGCQNVVVNPNDVDAVVSYAVDHQVDLVVVGPEDPLVAGLVDRLEAVGIAAFGPSAAAAQLEGSKSHCKDFLLKYGIPTGAAASFSDAGEAIEYLSGLGVVPVVKASGLAAGKGVIVAETRAEAETAITEILVDGRFGGAGSTVLLEERLYGPELSVLAFCDGTHFKVMPTAQDHKRLLEGDAGPNTGGMGAFHPSPIATAELLDQISTQILGPTLAALAAEGRPYRGVLYAGIMLTSDGPKVIEYNCRFGDPETQVVLPLLQTDIVEVFEACIQGRLAQSDIDWSAQAAATVVVAASGYPTSSSPSTPISGLAAAAATGCKVFHAGTAMSGHDVVTAGGRVVAVTALGANLDDAVARAYNGVGAVSFDGAQFRPDIGRSTAEVRA